MMSGVQDDRTTAPAAFADRLRKSRRDRSSGGTVHYPTEPVVLRTFLLLVVAVFPACATDPSGAEPTPAPRVTPTVGEASVVPSDAGLEEEGDCVNGYTAPPPAAPVRLDGLQLLAKAVADEAGERLHPDDFEVDEMRYFEGPESPPSGREYLLNVRRWYVKASLKDDPDFAARFLLERRTFGAGLVAVAPFDSEGFASPDWIGFQYEGEDADRQTYDGLPGTWAGTPYDFVLGKTLNQDEEVFGFPGLPVEVVGCLAGT
jgi:hypothetical protein